MSEGKAALLTLFVFTVVAIVVGVSRFLSNQRRQQKEARFEKLKQEAIRFFDQVTSTGKLPSPQTHVILRSGELALLDEPSILYETRAYRVSGGAGTRIGRVYVGGGVSESRQRLKQIDEGRLTLTTKRLIFDGSAENRTLPLSDILSVERWSDAIEVSAQRRAKSQVFHVENPLIWATMVDQAASGKGQFSLPVDG